MPPSTDLQPMSPGLPASPQDYAAASTWQQAPLTPPRSLVRRYLQALVRYKWILIAGLVCGAGAGLVTWKLIRPSYRAQGSLWISEDSRGAGDGGPISQGGLLQSYAWIDLLKSFVVLDPVVVERRLYLDHDWEDDAFFASFRVQQGEQFRPGRYRLDVAQDGRSYTMRTNEGLTVETGTPGSPVGTRLGFHWTPPAAEFRPERKVVFTVLNPRDAAVRLRDGLETRMDGLGTFIQVTLRDGDPERAAAVLGSVMGRTVDVARDLKRSKLDEANKNLAEQLRVVEDELRDSERELESFRVQTITLPTDRASAIAPGLQQTQGPVLDQFFQLRIQLEALRDDRQRVEAALADAEAGDLSIEALEVIPAVRESSQLVRDLQELTDAKATLNTLRQRYTDEHEGVRDAQAKVDNLGKVVVPGAVRAVLTQLKSREDNLAQAIRNRSSELAEIPPRVIEEARLERRVQISTTQYAELRQRYETSSLASRSSVPDVQILDKPAIPTVPEVDDRARWSLIAFGGLFGLALGLVLLLDKMDPRLRDPFDVTNEIGLPILATVPHLKTRTVESEMQVREAFRELRVNVDYAYGAVRPLVLCITSPAESEGKSFVSANLAIGFAGLGRRTLLVDGDTRRGNAHELLGRYRKPGLTDVLTDGDAPPNFQETERENLWLLSCGSRISASPDLLNSRRMQEMLAQARKTFEVIIIDSPPLSAGADAFVLAAHAGNLLVVLRSGSTNKSLATVKLEPLLRLPVRILGAVLNAYVPSALYGSYRYYGGYLKGYEVREESAEMQDEVAQVKDEAAENAPAGMIGRGDV